MTDWFYSGVFMEDGKIEKIIKAENEVQRNIFIKRGLKPYKEKISSKNKLPEKKIKKCPEKQSVN